jgi:hypothetical protein
MKLRLLGVAQEYDFSAMTNAVAFGSIWASNCPVPPRGRFMSDLTRALIGNPLRKTFIPFDTDVRARRYYSNA